MKNILVLLLGLIFLTETAAWAETKTPRPIKVGATLALSGKLAFIGTVLRHGLELAAEEINAGGGIHGHRLDLLFEDNGGDAKSAVNSVNKLINIDRVDVLFSSFTHITQAIKSVLSQQHRVMIYSSALPDIAQSHRLFFKDHFDSYSSGVLIGTLVHQNEHKRIVFLSEINDACSAYEAGLRVTLPQYDIKLVHSELYPPGDTDLRPMLLRFKGKHPEAMVLCTWRDTDLVMRQLNELGMLGIPTFHLIAPFLAHNDTPEIRKLLEVNRAKSIWYGFMNDIQSGRPRDFYDKYKNRFGDAPRPEAAYSYDDLFAIAQALSSCLPLDNGDINQDCLAESLLIVKLDGAGGPLYFDKDGVANRPLLAIEVRGGSWHELQSAPTAVKVMERANTPSDS